MRHFQFKKFSGLLSLLGVLLTTQCCVLPAYAGVTNDWYKATQYIKIGSTATADASAALDISSITKGALFPRMTTVQRDAISSPAAGLMIFNTDNNRMETYAGGAWGSIGRLQGGASSLNASAVWQADSTTKGVLIPRMDTTQRNAIASPATGLLIYNNFTGTLNGYDGTAWQELMDTTRAQTVTNKTLTGAVVSDYIQTTQVATPATPAAGSNRIYTKSDDKLYVLNSAGTETAVGSGSGSGTGAREYMSNAGAESLPATTGWATYADAAGVLPVDGTGGTASALTFSRTTTASEIIRETASFKLAKAASNAQGQGVSTDFALDPQDYKTGAPIYVSFDYVTSANYVAGDIKVFAFDKDFQTPLVLTVLDGAGLNGALPAAPNGGRFTGVFYPQANIDVNYRLGFHVASTNATAYNFFYDNVHAGGVNQIPGAIITAWKQYTPTFQGFGTVTSPLFYSRRVGDTLEIQGTFISGTATGAEARVSIGYDGQNANVATVTNWSGYVVGSGFVNAAGAIVFSMVSPVGGGAAYLNMGVAAPGQVGFAVSPGSTLAASGQVLGFNARVPIQGWTSGAQMSTGELNLQTPAPISASSAVKTPAGNGHWHAHTGNALTLSPGRYQLGGGVAFGNNGTTPGYFDIQAGWFGVNGNDSAALPSATPYLNQITGLTVEAPTNTINNIAQATAFGSGNFEAPTLTIKVTQTVTIYLDTYTALNTPANARIQVFPRAQRLPDFTMFGVVPTSLPVQKVYNVPNTYSYTPTPGAKTLRIRVCGAGGGGGGAAVSGSGTAGTGGGTTSFGSLISCTGGNPGLPAGNGTWNAGGNCTINAPAFGVAQGGAGGGAQTVIVGSGFFPPSGAGGNSVWGGAGMPAANQVGQSASASCSGASGGGGQSPNVIGGGGGAAGGSADVTLNNPVGPYSITIGSGGLGGNGTFVGGQGGNGLVVIDESF